MILASNLLTKIGVIVLTILVIIYILMYILTKKIYNILFSKRLDKTFLHFFTHNDFSSLEVEKIKFKSSNENTLRGLIYSYQSEIYKGIIVVSHGLGVGHLQYTKEIEHFAKLGFKVLAFDNTGCAESEGEAINGLPQGIIDLKSCLEFIKTREDLKSYKKILFGHSWGGYSSINVLPFTKEEDNIVGVVTLGAPYNSSEVFYDMLIQTSKGLKFTKPFISLIDKINFGDIAKMNTLASLSNVNYDALLIHGLEDPIVNYDNHFKFVFDNLKKDNIEFYSVEKKGHRPNISLEATNYEKKVNEDIANLKKNKASKEELKEYHDQIDYHKLTEFDDDVMNKIDEFILRHF